MQLKKEVQMPRSNTKPKLTWSGQNSMPPLKSTSLIEEFANENHLEEPQDKEFKTTTTTKLIKKFKKLGLERWLSG